MKILTSVILAMLTQSCIATKNTHATYIPKLTEDSMESIRFSKSVLYIEQNYIQGQGLYLPHFSLKERPKGYLFKGPSEEKLTPSETIHFSEKGNYYSSVEEHHIRFYAKQKTKDQTTILNPKCYTKEECKEELIIPGYWWISKVYASPIVENEYFLRIKGFKNLKAQEASYIIRYNQDKGGFLKYSAVLQVNTPLIFYENSLAIFTNDKIDIYLVSQTLDKEKSFPLISDNFPVAASLEGNLLVVDAGSHWEVKEFDEKLENLSYLFDINKEEKAEEYVIKVGQTIQGKEYVLTIHQGYNTPISSKLHIIKGDSDSPQVVNISKSNYHCIIDDLITINDKIFITARVSEITSPSIWWVEMMEIDSTNLTIKKKWRVPNSSSNPLLALLYLEAFSLKSKN